MLIYNNKQRRRKIRRLKNIFIALLGAILFSLAELFFKPWEINIYLQSCLFFIISYPFKWDGKNIYSLFGGVNNPIGDTYSIFGVYQIGKNTHSLLSLYTYQEAQEKCFTLFSLINKQISKQKATNIFSFLTIQKGMKTVNYISIMLAQNAHRRACARITIAAYQEANKILAGVYLLKIKKDRKTKSLNILGLKILSRRKKYFF